MDRVLSICNYCTFVTRYERDARKSKFCRRFFERLLGLGYCGRPTVGFQNGEPLRFGGRRCGQRTVEARKARVATGTLGDLARYLPCFRQTCSKRTVRALGKAVIAATAVERAKCR